MKQQRIAVLGGGIMGCSTAILLAREGQSVTLFDAGHAPFGAASRWNEGKIHLGFLYSADPTLETARKVIPGGLMFKPLVEELTGCSVDPVVTRDDDIFLCHRDSVVSAQAMEAYFHEVAQLIASNPRAGRYLADVSRCRVERLNGQQLGAITDSPAIVAGFRIPERSVSTNWLADRFIDAMAAERHIEPRMRTRVIAVGPVTAGDHDGPWRVETDAGVTGPFDWVVNALWQGRMAIDITAGISPVSDWSNRYRMALFVRTTRPVNLPSTVIATGPFGDIKNYNNRDFYLSWYPLGLRVDTSAVEPSTPAPIEMHAESQLIAAMFEQLQALLPETRRIREHTEQVSLAGGWVHAAGHGVLSDPASTLHRRSDFGISRSGRYVSVDTGKYSTAPWLAQRLVNELTTASRPWRAYDAQ
jgi:glycine/D-amino acid oxidase-like deaminating enzyme